MQSSQTGKPVSEKQHKQLDAKRKLPFRGTKNVSIRKVVPFPDHCKYFITIVVSVAGSEERVIRRRKRGWPVNRSDALTDAKEWDTFSWDRSWPKRFRNIVIIIIIIIITRMEGGELHEHQYSNTK